MIWAISRLPQDFDLHQKNFRKILLPTGSSRFYKFQKNSLCLETDRLTLSSLLRTIHKLRNTNLRIFRPLSLPCIIALTFMHLRSAKKHPPSPLFKLMNHITVHITARGPLQCRINALGEQIGVFIWSSSALTVTKRRISYEQVCKSIQCISMAVLFGCVMLKVSFLRLKRILQE